MRIKFVLLFSLMIFAFVNAITYPYWIEHNQTSNMSFTPYSSIWINTSTANLSFYVYYNGSNFNTQYYGGEKVFPYFDDFTGNQLNSSVSQLVYTSTPPVATFVNDIAYLKAPSSSGQHLQIRSISQINCTTPTAYGWANDSGGWIMVGHGNNVWNSSWYNWNTPLLHSRLLNGQYSHISNEYTNYQLNSINYLSWGLISLMHNDTTAIFYLRNLSTSYTFINVTSLSYPTPQYVWVGVVLGHSIVVDYVLCSNYNPQFPITITYGNAETGSWFFNGVAYTMRRQVNITSNINMSAFPNGYQIPLSYSQFNNSNITITNESGSFYAANFTNIVYENTNTLHSVTTSGVNITSAWLNYSNTLYPATVVNTTYAFVNFTVPLVSVNATNFAFNWIIYTGTQNVSTGSFNQTVIFASYLPPQQNIIATQNTNKEINITVDEYYPTILNSSTVIVNFNGTNYTATKINNTLYTVTLPIPTQSDFIKTYTLTYYYYVNSTLLRNTQTASLSSVKYLATSLCSDYLKDSGLYRKFTANNKTYYLHENTQVSKCINDQALFFIHYSDTSMNYYMIDNDIYFRPNGSSISYQTPPFTFASHLPFIENKTVTITSNSGGTFNVTFTNTSGSTTTITDGQTAQWIFDGVNAKICNQNTGSCIYILTGEYNVSFKMYISSSGPENHTKLFSSGANWFFNASYNYRSVNNTRTFFYINKNLGFTISPPTVYNYNTGKYYAYYIWCNISNSQTIQDNINQIILEEKPTYGALDSRLISQEMSGNYSAYLLTSNNQQIIYPKFSRYIYITNNQGTTDVIFINRFNNQTYATTLYSNIPTIIQDTYGICYFIPPFTPSNSSQYITMTAYQTNCESSIVNIPDLPLLPTLTKCYTFNNTYIIDVKYDQEVLFERTKIQNGIIDYYQATGKEYSENISLNNVSTIQLNANGKTRCYYTSDNSVLGLGSLQFPTLPSNLLGIPLILIATGISMIHPFAFIFVFAVNDVFRILTAEAIFLLATGVGLFAFISNWGGERNLKALIILFLLASAYVIQLHHYAAFDNDNIQALTNFTDSMTQLFGGIGSGDNLIAIVTTVLPIFLLNLIVLILQLPAIVIHIIFNAIYLLAPAMATYLGALEGALIVGAYVYIILKGYEMGRNMFRSV